MYSGSLTRCSGSSTLSHFLLEYSTNASRDCLCTSTAFYFSSSSIWYMWTKRFAASRKLFCANNVSTYCFRLIESWTDCVNSRSYFRLYKIAKHSGSASLVSAEQDGRDSWDSWVISFIALVSCGNIFCWNSVCLCCATIFLEVSAEIFWSADMSSWSNYCLLIRYGKIP